MMLHSWFEIDCSHSKDIINQSGKEIISGMNCNGSQIATKALENSISSKSGG